MAKINARGVVIGGLVAGLIINVSEAILNMPVIGTQLAAALAARNLPQIAGNAVAGFIVLGFALGVVLVWLYAAIRPRFGPGPKTAAKAAVAVWFLAYFYGSIGYAVLGVFPSNLLAIAILWGLVELIVAALVGARMYSET